MNDNSFLPPLPDETDENIGDLLPELSDNTMQFNDTESTRNGGILRLFDPNKPTETGSKEYNWRMNEYIEKFVPLRQSSSTQDSLANKYSRHGTTDESTSSFNGTGVFYPDEPDEPDEQIKTIGNIEKDGLRDDKTSVLRKRAVRGDTIAESLYIKLCAIDGLSEVTDIDDQIKENLKDIFQFDDGIQQKCNDARRELVECLKKEHIQKQCYEYVGLGSKGRFDYDAQKNAGDPIGKLKGFSIESQDDPRKYGFQSKTYYLCKYGQKDIFACHFLEIGLYYMLCESFS